MIIYFYIVAGIYLDNPLYVKLCILIGFTSPGGDILHPNLVFGLGSEVSQDPGGEG